MFLGKVVVVEGVFGASHSLGGGRSASVKQWQPHSVAASDNPEPPRSNTGVVGFLVVGCWGPDVVLPPHSVAVSRVLAIVRS